MRAFKEAVDINLFREYNAMKKSNNKSDYHLGRLYVYEGIIKFIRNNTETGDINDHSDEQVKIMNDAHNLIKKGGELLNKSDCMNCPLFWSFIPNRFHRNVDLCFNNIGRWRA